MNLVIVIGGFGHPHIPWLEAQCPLRSPREFTKAQASTELLGIQIDAAINSGNSGGPLGRGPDALVGDAVLGPGPAFNERGECLGMASGGHSCCLCWAPRMCGQHNHRHDVLFAGRHHQTAYACMTDSFLFLKWLGESLCSWS